MSEEQSPGGVLHEEWAVQYDGDPKMGGGCHVQTMGQWRTLKEAELAIERVLTHKPNIHIMHRWTSEWKDLA